MTTLRTNAQHPGKVFHYYTDIEAHLWLEDASEDSLIDGGVVGLAYDCPASSTKVIYLRAISAVFIDDDREVLRRIRKISPDTYQR